MDLSIVIVSYNVRDLLVGCLRSLEQTQGDLQREVFLVDNASGDGTVETVSRLFPTVQVIANAENRGFAAANNQGLRLARGRHALLLNPDTTVAPGALAAMVAFLDRTPDAGIVGCRIHDGAGHQQLSCFPFPTVATVFWQHWQLHRFFPPFLYSRYRRQCLAPGQAEPFPVGWVTGACFMIKHETLATVGLLDERYFLFVEEVDFCRRAAQLGWRTYFLPAAGVVHLESRSTRQVVPVKLTSHYLSKLHYFAKFERPRSLLLLRGIFLCELALKAAIRAVGAPFRRPPDAARRLSTYASIALACLTYPGQNRTDVARKKR